jgi:hypothetical protein
VGEDLEESILDHLLVPGHIYISAEKLVTPSQPVDQDVGSPVCARDDKLTLVEEGEVLTAAVEIVAEGRLGERHVFTERIWHLRPFLFERQELIDYAMFVDISTERQSDFKP